MSEFEKEAVKLNKEELDQVVGGYKPLPPKEGFIVYQVQAPDNLTKLARRFNCTVNDILLWNPKIKDKNLIYTGDYLYIKQP